MLADITGPCGNEGVEACCLSREQSPCRLLETGKVSGYCGHEAIGGLLRSAPAVALGMGAPGLVDQPTQRHRGATRLLVKPLPVSRQQSHLARHHAELRPPGSPRRR